MKKYIVIPEFTPLYAMRKIFGPQTGPVRKPIFVDCEIIKELLTQKPPVKVLEVKLTNAKLGQYSETIELTTLNYNTVNFVKAEEAATISAPVVSESIGVELKPSEVTVDTPLESVEPEAEPVEVSTIEPEAPVEEPEKVDGAAEETETVDVSDLVAAVTVEEEKEDVVSEAVKPMTKAERRAAARAAAASTANQNAE